MLDTCRIVAAVAVCTLCKRSFSSGMELSELKNLKVYPRKIRHKSSQECLGEASTKTYTTHHR